MNPPTQQQLEEIKQSLFAGRKIEAIKRYRTATNQRLKESKDAVEQLETQLRQTHPSQFAKAESTNGCFSMVLAGVVAMAVVILFLIP